LCIAQLSRGDYEACFAGGNRRNGSHGRDFSQRRNAEGEYDINLLGLHLFETWEQDSNPTPNSSVLGESTDVPIWNFTGNHVNDDGRSRSLTPTLTIPMPRPASLTSQPAKALNSTLDHKSIPAPNQRPLSAWALLLDRNGIPGIWHRCSAGDSYLTEFYVGAARDPARARS
jgi:hypothetical protein